MKKTLIKIISISIALVILLSSFAFASNKNINPQFYENAAQQAMNALANATTTSDKVFYIVTAMYDYCYTSDVSRASELLDELSFTIGEASDSETIKNCSALASQMTSGAGDLLVEKQEFAEAKKMYEAALSYYENFDAKPEDVEHCQSQITVCEKGSRVDLYLVIAIIVIVVAAAAMIIKESKKSGKKNDRR